MAGLPRKTQKIFGSTLTPTGNVAVVGSLSAGAPAFSGDLAIIQSLAQYLNGWQGAQVGSKSPALEDMTAMFYLVTTQLAYLLTRGLAEWDANTTYDANDFARVGSQVYVSKIDANTNNDPTIDTNSWVPLASTLRGSKVAAAWVVFDGINATAGNSRIIASDNVDHVVRNGDGSYTVVFAAALSSDHYAIGGSCGSEDAEPYGVGDDGVVVGNVAGQGDAIRNSAQCRIFTINPTNKVLVQSGCVSAFFFAP